jgi:hypothetical protein
MGMDWHSSGITTSVLGALKRGLNPRAHELGIWVCGGRGPHSRRTPDELRAIADQTGLEGDSLVRSSRLTAKIDNNAVGDGFQLYLHGFLLTAKGEWAVVQQGMNEATGYARRYHWHSASVRDFVNDPHTAIVGEHQGEILNLVDSRADPARDALLNIGRDDPERTLQLARKHEVTRRDVDLKRLGAVLAVAYDKQLHDFVRSRRQGPASIPRSTKDLRRDHQRASPLSRRGETRGQRQVGRHAPARQVRPCCRGAGPAGSGLRRGDRA